MEHSVSNPNMATPGLPQSAHPAPSGPAANDPLASGSDEVVLERIERELVEVDAELEALNAARGN